ncbi:methylated-DNA--[protein]-cysteine S-methyltransferase [Actinomycetospora straminea]|uniref:Methylated-DNA--[protein]-cysteine S-methyltransferase n=1 Tax=Actinomycetospora straminea TaxID=663607 RepID=A0ABP9DUA2_9PSEU|nr:methylated-DNA--[protein]-cysteine S-methyltransferase [Actinomycetospora straminea]MDD7936304.1 methylated-DNA--[protein]-cysteine S-methyltransferase [Actinomycetospora straminea]
MTDPVLAALRDLAEPAPTSLAERVVDGWLRVPGPLGEVYAVVGDRGVRLLRPAAFAGELDAFLEDYRTRHGRPVRPAPRAPRGLLPALRGRGEGPALDLGDLTPFAREVLAVTARIPVGQTRPYGWVAREAGRPKAVRAVGTVLARNPVPLLVPCHRVVRGDGDLGQYLSGRADKVALLEREGVEVAHLEALAAAGTRLVGSDTTGVVCFPTCHHARRITAAHRHGFPSLERARDAGYRPCRDCRP